MEFLRKLWSEEEGQGMVEYGLIIALVAIVAIVGLKLLAPQLNLMFKNIETELKPTTVTIP